MPLIPLVEPVALQAVVPRPPGSISVAPRGMVVMLELLVPLAPGMPSGEVAPIPEGLTAVCALLAPQVNSSASAAIDNRRCIEISWSALRDTQPGQRSH